MRTLLLALMGYQFLGSAPTSQGPEGLPPAAIPTGVGQVIVVRPHGDKPFQVEVSAWERGMDGKKWTRIVPRMAGVIGPKGFAPPGEKKEGDGRTPSGVFRIGAAFGHDPTLETKLAYRQAAADDYWVDDPESKQYNRWVHGKPIAKSFEKLRIDAYKRAAVIEYNTDPVVPDKGSAIFLHIWGGPDKPTAGCVALAEQNVTNLLRWLDRDRHPVIVLNR